MSNSKDWRSDDVLLEIPVETTDIKATCIDMLEEAKSQLEADGHLPSMIFAIQDKRICALAIKWNSYEEKDWKLNTALGYAKHDKKTLAIATINDCRMKAMPVETKEEDIRIREGEICENESNPEVLVMSVSGPGFKPWAVMARYHRSAEGEIIWDEQTDALDNLKGRMFAEFPEEAVS